MVNIKYLFTAILFLSLFFVDIVYSQQLIYEYSPTGNRKKCYVGFAKISSPTDPSAQEQYTENMDDIQFTIYPNPTKGLLKVSIDTEIKVDSLRLELYDVNGKQVISKLSILKEIELDITSSLAGNYFMKVFVNGKPYYWNILKEE